MSVESVINVMETPQKCGCNDCFRVIRGWYDLTFVTVMSVVRVLGVMRVVKALIIEFLISRVL